MGKELGWGVGQGASRGDWLCPEGVWLGCGGPWVAGMEYRRSEALAGTVEPDPTT